ncbi:hypothetical protein [Sphingomonas morindae]|uniref:Uncharacterized protein n=1 Tax=Sphingomonas morindae TaxID=1541170 RepID=A0ABY4X5J8_9SPHN|nr:hypothetical protein [Sphingomonas morindae]USI72122.1 hypothetical protein LHA26_12510 [Sphingomonas morindae]
MIARRAGLAGGLVLALAAPAAARVTVQPYIEAQQVFSADLSGNGDAVTYTGVGAGIDVAAESARFRGQLSYRYDHYFSWSRRYPDGDIHNGLASGSYRLGDGFSLDGAAIATRSRGTLAASSPGLLLGSFSNTQQIYGGQIGPSFRRSFGDLNAAADYRFGYTHVDQGSGAFSLGPGQTLLDPSFDTLSHSAQASLGARPGHGLPFGWQLGGGLIHDEIHLLDQRYDGRYVRLDLTQPIAPTVALVGGVGYETNRASQRPVQLDSAGAPVIAHGRLVPDRAAPRLLVYDQDGLLWDVGVLWRPSTRFELEARGGRRYGDWAATGHLLWRPSATATVQVVAYNDIQSFGRQLTGGIGALGDSFTASNMLIPVSLGGCVFGANGGQGGCLPALSSIAANFYRSRGIWALVSATHGRWTYGLGVNYDHRRYLGVATPGVASLAGVADETVTVNGLVARQLSARSTLSGTLYIGWYDSGLAGAVRYTSYGATGTYSHAFGRRLLGQAAISVYSGAGGAIDQDVIGSALLGLRYQL